LGFRSTKVKQTKKSTPNKLQEEEGINKLRRTFDKTLLNSLKKNEGKCFQKEKRRRKISNF